jgi:hypothetical protein
LKRWGKKPAAIIGRLSGWWLTDPSEKYDFVSWDENVLPTEWKK